MSIWNYLHPILIMISPIEMVFGRYLARVTKAMFLVLMHIIHPVTRYGNNKVKLMQVEQRKTSISRISLSSLFYPTVGH